MQILTKVQIYAIAVLNIINKPLYIYLINCKYLCALQDTEMIVWDIIAECGQHRLSGHKGAITQVCFMQDVPVLISSSKDSLVKFWDLDTGHCFKTLVAHKAEVNILCDIKDIK
jgi:WD40 repeat protein